MALITAFFTYLVKFIVFIGIAAAGFVLGKKIRDNKNARKTD